MEIIIFLIAIFAINLLSAFSKTPHDEPTLNDTKEIPSEED